MRFASIAVVVLGLVAKTFAGDDADRCTTIVVAKGAGTEGPMTSHTADCLDCDFRLNKVPARDWPAGKMRPLYVYKGSYPATVSKERGETWHPSNLEGSPSQLSAWGNESAITGWLPEVAHTFALVEAGYAIMNERQVAIGESTCAARLTARSAWAGGRARVEARELSRLALERAESARAAVLLMGAVAEQLGFYGADESLGEAGEALTVTDADEAWVFHILADDTGSSAVWAAQRVPEGHVSVVANQFVIRKIKKDSPDFLYSANLWSVAERAGLWHPARAKEGEKEEELDFLKVFAPPRGHPQYCSRRVWRALSLAAPSLNLKPPSVVDDSLYSHAADPSDPSDPDGGGLPFSVPADRPISPAGLMAMLRDHYEGVTGDLTQGPAAGPYGDPNRFDPAVQTDVTLADLAHGTYERHH